MPPIEVPWPPMNLVAEWITMSAPWSKGRSRKGVGIVLSTTSGIPASCAIFETAAKSSVSSLGFPTVSAKIAFVFFVSAFRKLSGSFGSTNFTSIPIFGKV